MVQNYEFILNWWLIWMHIWKDRLKKVFKSVWTHGFRMMLVEEKKKWVMIPFVMSFI